jgi:SAM-dependent methyltransferase
VSTKLAGTENARTTRSPRRFAELLGDRLRKKGLYDSPAYWDMKAESYSGLARSNWPSNTYNQHVHASQMALIDRLLGDVSGKVIADLGCGTGRTVQHLARRGARVTGFDFSEAAVRAARRETAELGLCADYQVRDVHVRPGPSLSGRFDVVLSLACLTVACCDRFELDRALETMVCLSRKPGGRLLLLEPFHSSRLLRRIAPVSAVEFAERATRRGLSLVGRGGIQFVPFRYALAFRDFPPPLVAALHRTGEWLLDEFPALEPLSDYKWLLFENR